MVPPSVRPHGSGGPPDLTPPHGGALIFDGPSIRENFSLLSDRLESDDDQGKVKWENLVDIYLFFLYDRICIFQYFK